MKRILVLMAVLSALPISLSAKEKRSALSDGQIISIVVAAHQIDADAGRLAAENSASARVRDFGARMAEERDALNRQTGELCLKLNISPEENATSLRLRAEGELRLAKLRELQGTDFDRAYLAHEVTYCQEIIKMMKDILIPSSHHKELRNFLKRTVSALTEHLERARTLQSNAAGRRTGAVRKRPSALKQRSP